MTTSIRISAAMVQLCCLSALLAGCGNDADTGPDSALTSSASTASPPVSTPGPTTQSSGNQPSASPSIPLPPDMNMPLAPTTPNATGSAPSAPSATPTGAGGGTAGSGGEGQGGVGAAGQSSGGAGNASSGDAGNDGESSGEAGEDSGEAGEGGSAETSVGESDENGPDAGLPAGTCAVQPLTDEFRENYDNLDPFYQKYADAAGLPVVSSMAPSDEALERVCLLVLDMISARPDVHEALLDNYIRFAVIGNDELTNDIPEYSDMPDSINERARGLGGTPAASCAEESILCDTTRDRWRGEGICVHEFAHTIASGGLFPADDTFQDRLQDAFENAQSTGLFEDTYAMENYQEYWAEGVQDWYFTNLESDPPNGVHNSIDRREELLAYDPALYELIAEFLPDEPQFVDCYSDE